MADYVRHMPAPEKKKKKDLALPNVGWGLAHTHTRDERATTHSRATVAEAVRTLI